MTTAAPFLKWAGGKRKLVPKLLELAPRSFSRYVEPFVGGGAMFFGLRNAGYTGPALLCDANAELVDAYRSVRQAPDALMSVLSLCVNDEAAFYAVRAMQPESLSHIARSGRFIYLNKTGFNGLYRVNKAGQFNVPFGRYKAPKICDEPTIRAAHWALYGATVLHRSFEELDCDIRAGDLVYCDPPYFPASDTADFTAYTAGGFGRDQQQRLAELARGWAARGATVMISNADIPETRNMYEGMQIESVQMARNINSVAKGRGKVGEIIAISRPATKARAA